MHSHGWLFDVYPAHDTMVVWLYWDDGTLLRLEDPFRPRLYAWGRRQDLRALARAVLRSNLCRRCVLTTRQEFWSGQTVPVLALEITDYGRLPRLVHSLPPWEERLTFVVGCFPLARVRSSMRARGFATSTPLRRASSATIRFPACASWNSPSRRTP